MWGGSTAVDAERIGGLLLEIEELAGKRRIRGNGPDEGKRGLREDMGDVWRERERERGRVRGIAR